MRTAFTLTGHATGSLILATGTICLPALRTSSEVHNFQTLVAVPTVSESVERLTWNGQDHWQSVFWERCHEWLGLEVESGL